MLGDNSDKGEALVRAKKAAVPRRKKIFMVSSDLECPGQLTKREQKPSLINHFKIKTIAVLISKVR